MLDFSRCRLPPFQHQREDVEWLIEQPFAFIASEMRTGKTKIVIDSAQFLFERGEINTVIVVAPAPVRDVWADQVLGEIAKHAWADLPNKVIEYHARLRVWSNGAVAPGLTRPPLTWYVTNFEFLRSKNRLTQLLPACGPKTLLIADESSFIKNYQAQQTKAFAQLRKACGRVVLLNGTPIFHSPKDLFSQGNILSPVILDCPYITHFLARYAVQVPVLGAGGKALKSPYGAIIQKVSEWTEEGLEDLQRRFAPYTRRRLQKDCLDLPPKLDPVVLTARMPHEEWAHYKQMRDEMVIWLKSGQVAVSGSAAIKAMRLAQITSGFVGGIEDPGFNSTGRLDDGLLESVQFEDRPGELQWTGASFDGNIQTHRTPEDSDGTSDRLDTGERSLLERSGDSHLLVDEMEGSQIGRVPPVGWQTIGRAKLDVLLWFIEQRLEADPNLKVVVWCKFRAELFRVLAEVSAKFPQFETATILGDQKKADRLRSLSLLKPETAPPGPVFAIGIEGTGSFGLDMAASHTCVTLSSGYSPGRSAQTLDRVYGPGQKHPIAYYDVIATGPDGQRTIDHAIVAARRQGQDVAQWTAAAWVKVLTEE